MMNFRTNIDDTTRQEWIKNTLRGLGPGKILDAGAGFLRNKQYCNHLEYYSQDFCEYTGKGDKKGLQNEKWDVSNVDYISDITSIPVNSSSFDYIVCTEVLEHIPYPVDAIKEFYRILKPGGLLIITAPFNSLTHQSPYHMYGGFNHYFYERVLVDKGFSNITCDANGNYYSYMQSEAKRVGYMAKNYANSKFHFIYKVLSIPIYLLYGALNLISKDTSDLLCFGYHVKATKNLEDL